MLTSTKKGIQGENVASDYLVGLNYKIIGRNFHCPFGEIDIVAIDRKEIVFVEVKERQNLKYGRPEDAIGRSKLNKIIKTIHYFFIRNSKFRNLKYRIDAVTIYSNINKYEINHFKNIG